MEPIRIILGEDHALVREGTRRILEQYPDLSVVGEAGDGEQVLELAARGMRNRAIADALKISVRTVEGHVNSILTKLGVSSRLEAVLLAASRGWVVLEGEESP